MRQIKWKQLKVICALWQGRTGLCGDFRMGLPLSCLWRAYFSFFLLYLGPVWLTFHTQFDLPVRPCPVGLGNRILLAIEPDCCFPHTVKWYSANDSQQGRSRDILSLRTRAIGGGPRSSAPCGPRKSSKWPSRTHPYEPWRPRRTGWLDVMRPPSTQADNNQNTDHELHVSLCETVVSFANSTLISWFWVASYSWYECWTGSWCPLMLHLSLVVLLAVHIHLPDVADKSSGPLGGPPPRGISSWWHVLVAPHPSPWCCIWVLWSFGRSTSISLMLQMSLVVILGGPPPRGISSWHQKQCIFQCSNRAPLTVCPGGADPTAPRPWL